MSNAEAASQALGAFSGSTEDEVAQGTAAGTSSKKRVAMDKDIEIQRILESITDDDLDNLDEFDDFDIGISQLVSKVEEKNEEGCKDTGVKTSDTAVQTDVAIPPSAEVELKIIYRA